MRSMSVGMWWDMVLGEGGNEGVGFGEWIVRKAFRGL